MSCFHFLTNSGGRCRSKNLPFNMPPAGTPLPHARCLQNKAWRLEAVSTDDSYTVATKMTKMMFVLWRTASHVMFFFQCKTIPFHDTGKRLGQISIQKRRKTKIVGEEFLKRRRLVSFKEPCHLLQTFHCLRGW